MEHEHRLEELDRQWRQALQQSSYQKRAVTPAVRDRYWQSQAKEYDARMHQDFRRVDRVLQHLLERGYLSRQSKVLDLGCGTGTYTIELAKRAQQVTALDLSPAMGRVLKSKAQANGLTNINFVQADWDKVDLNQTGLYQSMDLTVSGLNPSIHGLDALKKLTQTSRGACCLITFAGKIENQVRSDLEQLLYQRGPSEMSTGYNVLYPFQILYALGHFPEVTYTQMAWVKEHSCDAAIDRLEQEHRAALEGHPQLRQALGNYVRTHLDTNGMFRERNQTPLGIISWQTGR